MKVFTASVLLSVFLSGLVGANPINPEEEDGANMKYFLVEKSDGTYDVEDLVNSKITATAAELDISYHFYSKKDSKEGTVLRGDQISLLKNTDFSASKDTMFIIHGWRSGSDGEINQLVREALLSRYDINIFIVDWNPVADANYITAKNAVVPVGEFVAAFIENLVSTYLLKVEMVACAGHSLGAHICGNAGKVLNGRLHHIVALDPASPLFSVADTSNRVHTTDAQFVQVIHTNGNLLGFGASLGHSDYFPNGGRSQPGCGSDWGGSCAHSRSYEYYAESITTNTNLFHSRNCVSYTDYEDGSCTHNHVSFMGGYEIDTSAKGDYFLDTNASPLYSKG